MDLSPELIGLAGGAFTNLGLVPQVLQAYRTRSVADLSLHFILLTTIGIVLWLLYGLTMGLSSVILWNCLTLIMLASLIFAKLRFQNPRIPEQPTATSPFPVVGDLDV